MKREPQNTKHESCNSIKHGTRWQDETCNSKDYTLASLYGIIDCPAQRSRHAAARRNRGDSFGLQHRWCRPMPWSRFQGHAGYGHESGSVECSSRWLDKILYLGLLWESYLYTYIYIGIYICIDIHLYLLIIEVAEPANASRKNQIQSASATTHCNLHSRLQRALWGICLFLGISVFSILGDGGGFCFSSVQRASATDMSAKVLHKYFTLSATASCSGMVPSWMSRGDKVHSKEKRSIAINQSLAQLLDKNAMRSGQMEPRKHFSSDLNNNVIRNEYWKWTGGQENISRHFE